MHGHRVGKVQYVSIVKVSTTTLTTRSVSDPEAKHDMVWYSLLWESSICGARVGTECTEIVSTNALARIQKRWLVVWSLEPRGYRERILSCGIRGRFPSKLRWGRFRGEISHFSVSRFSEWRFLHAVQSPPVILSYWELYGMTVAILWHIYIYIYYYIIYYN